MSNKLAIIIPAYKAAFFDKTLDSLSRQTDKNFKVYIGDDDSPHDLEKIVSNYHGRLDITYKRFPTNLGSTDLVRHWNRCLDMLQDEDFFCLFSDDDIMEIKTSGCAGVIVGKAIYEGRVDLARCLQNV